MCLCVWIFMYLSMYMLVPVSLYTLVCECMSVHAYLCLCLSTCMLVCVPVNVHMYCLSAYVYIATHSKCQPWAVWLGPEVPSSHWRWSSRKPSLLPLRDKALSRGQVTCSRPHSKSGQLCKGLIARLTLPL